MSYYTKNELIYRKLKDEIIEGQLRPGERIIISEVAQRYNVSAMPIREAIKRLQQEGFVEVIPHVGAKVASLDLDRFIEIALIRIELEALAAKLATPHIDEGRIRKLEDIIEEMKRCIASKDNINYARLNKEFHTTIYSAGPYKYLFQLIMTLWDKSEFSRTIFTRVLDRAEKSIEEHKNWLMAIKEGDAEKAGNIARAHKESAFKMLIKSLKEEREKLKGRLYNTP